MDADRFLSRILIGLIILGWWLLQPVHTAHATDHYCRKADRLFKASLAATDTVEKIKILKSLIEDCPSRADAHNNLGLLYEERGRLELAEQHYRRAAELRPGYPHPYAGLGDVYRAQGNFDQAAANYRRFLDRALQPHNQSRFPELQISLGAYEKKLAQCESHTGEKAQSVMPSGEIIRGLTRGIGRGVGGVRISFRNILFEFDSDRISDSSSQQLSEIAKALKSSRLRQARIRIEGHTDNVGSDDYNMVLSLRRALSVKRYLVSRYAVASDNLEVVGFGERRPVASNLEETGRALNRRVEFVNLEME